MAVSDFKPKPTHPIEGSLDVDDAAGSCQPSRGWSRQNVLWVGMAVVWWLGSFLSWVVAYSQPELVATKRLLLDENSLNGGAIVITGLFIVLISATLRLPAITATASTTLQQNYLVWILGIGANLNWLGMLCLRSASFWVAVPAMVIALAVEYWLLDFSQILKKFLKSRSSQDSSHTESADSGEAILASEALNPVGPTGQGLTLRACADDRPEPSQTEVGRLCRTMTDQIDSDGVRLLTGEIFLDWLEGQRAQTLVVGFVPAFTSIPTLEFEAECAQTAVRCLNCTEVGFRVELRRSGSLDASESVLAWCANQTPHQECNSPRDRNLPGLV